jgi:enediyne biosynthesis protein E4
MKTSISGLFIKGEVRDIQQINTPKGNDIIVARNNDSLQIFQKRN